MPSFLPKTVLKTDPVPACVDLRELFEGERFAGSVSRVLNFLHNVYLNHSDGSFERISRPNVATEQFFLCMPTVDAYLAEIQLANATHAHALGKVSDKKIKISLKKYLETHTFVYSGFDRTIKSGGSPFTGRDVAIYDLNWLPLRFGGNHVLNAIQMWLLTKLEMLSGNNSEFETRQL